MNKKLFFWIITTIIIISTFVGFVYAKYQKDINVTYTATTGEMICDVEIEQSDKYKVNGIPYFLVKVKNYKEENGNKTLTATNIEYTLTIRNKDTSSNGMFIWQKVGNATDYTNAYLATVTTNEYSFGTTEQEDVFKVFVKNSQSVTSSTDINVKVELSAVQKEGN